MRPPPGTRLPLSEAEKYFPTDREFALDGIAGRIRLSTAQDDRLGLITVNDFAELLPLVDVIRWYSGEIQFPFGKWRSGVIVEWVAEIVDAAVVVGTLDVTEAADSAAVVVSSERGEDTPQAESEVRIEVAGTSLDVKSSPPTKNQLQAAYNARVTADHVPTIEQDYAWAKQRKISKARVLELRKANPDSRLRQKGPRRSRR
jgi:hypothetical protein